MIPRGILGTHTRSILGDNSSVAHALTLHSITEKSPY